MTGPHERWDELAAGYALDALEPAEEAELMDHLPDCEVCRAALRDHEYVAAQLGALAEDADEAPPWSAIRTGVVGELAERRTASRTDRARRPLLLGAAAAGVVIVAATVTAVSVTGGTSARDAAVSACRAQSACHVVELSRGNHERAVVIVRNDTARLLPTDLGAPSGGRVYALWQLPSNGKPTLLAQPVPRSGSRSAPLALPYDETAAFALSVEPAGPRATTPTTVVAVGTATT
jgi:anti-sigma factor RsiW